MIYPVLGRFLDKEIQLSGVTNTSELSDFNIQNVMDGSYQTSFNNWWDENFPGRSLLINIRGQLLYTFLNQSSNTNVTIEKDKYLFSPGYITTELGANRIEDEMLLQDLGQKLISLEKILKENGKELYIFMTPNKAHFCSDKISWKFNLLKSDDENNYNMFKKLLEKTDLKYFDSREYIENYNGEKIDAPIFYPTGIHWSSSWGMHAAIAFEEYINENSKWELSELECKESPCNEPQWPDADLYQSLNIISQPKQQYYTASISIKKEKDKPNVFIRGGSFLGQSLNGIISAGVFKKDVHLENTYYFTNRYSKKKDLSSYTSYDEMNLDKMLGETDILILEVNENSLDAMGFGFIEYVLEHPEYFNNNE